MNSPDVVESCQSHRIPSVVGEHIEIASPWQAAALGDTATEAETGYFATCSNLNGKTYSAVIRLRQIRDRNKTAGVRDDAYLHVTAQPPCHLFGGRFPVPQLNASGVIWRLITDFRSAQCQELRDFRVV